MIVIETIIYIYVYSMFSMNELGTWLFFGGISIVLYVLLFFIQRIAGFFTGVLGSALMLLYVVNAFGLQNMEYLYPVCLTVCAVCGLLTVVYKRAGSDCFYFAFRSVRSFLRRFLY